MGGLSEAGIGHGEFEESLRSPRGAVQWSVGYMSVVPRRCWRTLPDFGLHLEQT